MISFSLGLPIIIFICCNVVGEYWELHLPVCIRKSTKNAVRKVVWKVLFQDQPSLALVLG